MKSQSSPPSSISLHLDRQQVLETKYYWNLLIKDIFQLYLWQTGWSRATMSCRSTPRRTSSMAPSASWSCPSSVDLASTLTGWHTGWWDLFALIFSVSIFCIRSVTYGVSKLCSLRSLRLICIVGFSQKISLRWVDRVMISCISLKNIKQGKHLPRSILFSKSWMSLITLLGELSWRSQQQGNDQKRLSQCAEHWCIPNYFSLIAADRRSPRGC